MTLPISTAWREYLTAVHAFSPEVLREVERAARTLVELFENDGVLLVCGNGGSASDAGHMVGELVKSFRLSRPVDEPFRGALKDRMGADDAERLAAALEGGFRVLSLSAHTELITAISNDQGAEYVFAQQVVAWGRAGDCLLGISTSGSSRNVVLAAVAARAKGMRVIGLTGPDGGLLAQNADIVIRTPGGETAAIQDLHRPIVHALCMAVEDAFYG